MKLTVNTWDGPTLHSQDTGEPAADQVAAALDRLDGARCTEISLAQDEPFAQFTVGGGPDLYLVTGETADEEILQLTSPGEPADTVSLVCGGQLADFTRRDLVTRDAALAVLTRFLRDEPYDPALAWDIQ